MRPPRLAAELRPPLAARVRPDPEGVTENNPPPIPPEPAGPAAPARPAVGDADGERELLARRGIDDLDGLAGRCQQVRSGLGQSAATWTARRLLEVLHDAVVIKGWPAPLAAAALVTVARNPMTQSPRRLACPGPW